MVVTGCVRLVNKMIKNIAILAVTYIICHMHFKENANFQSLKILILRFMMKIYDVINKIVLNVKDEIIMIVFHAVMIIF